jgi:hypothetical protein
VEQPVPSHGGEVRGDRTSSQACRIPGAERFGQRPADAENRTIRRNLKIQSGHVFRVARNVPGEWTGKGGGRPENLLQPANEPGRVALLLQRSHCPAIAWKSDKKLRGGDILPVSQPISILLGSIRFPPSNGTTGNRLAEHPGRRLEFATRCDHVPRMAYRGMVFSD